MIGHLIETGKIDDVLMTVRPDPLTETGSTDPFDWFSLAA